MDSLSCRVVACHIVDNSLTKQKTNSMDLHELIITHNWSAAIDRAQSHPHEIRASYFNYARGHYTVLHSLIADHHAERGQEIVPVARAILRAADEINYAIDGDTVARMSDEIRVMSGSWRLLLNQNNRARWSPLHLLCTQGGRIHGMLKVLLQINEGNDDNILQYQRKVLTLVDSLERNILHHLVNSQDLSLEVVEFIVTLSPALLYQQDNHYMAPLEYVLDRLDWTRRQSLNQYMLTHTSHRPEDYKMLCLFVSALEQDVRMRIGRGEESNHYSNMTGSRPGTHNTHNYYAPTARNALHAACLLPWSVGPSDGSLIKYLARSRWVLNGVVLGDGRVMAEEEDSDGNLALHLFVSNMSYSHCKRGSNDSMANISKHLGKQSLCNLEDVVRILIMVNPKAVLTPNKDNMLPLRLAMKAGRRYAIALLVMKYPGAVHADECFTDIKLLGHLLSCLSDEVLIKSQAVLGAPNACLSTMFQLLRARPDIITSVDMTRPEMQHVVDRVDRIFHFRHCWYLLWLFVCLCLNFYAWAVHLKVVHK